MRCDAMWCDVVWSSIVWCGVAAEDYHDLALFGAHFFAPLQSFIAAYDQELDAAGGKPLDAMCKSWLCLTGCSTCVAAALVSLAVAIFVAVAIVWL